MVLVRFGPHWSLLGTEVVPFAPGVLGEWSPTGMMYTRGSDTVRALSLPVFLAGYLIAGAAMAQTDDVKWVNQCIADSAGIAGTNQQKTLYCACMVGKMSDRETRSVTQWEAANPNAAKDCAKRAGWE